MFFWRDAHGTEVDFALEQNGRLRLIEAKWAEVPADPRALASLLKVRDQLGERAADVHWVACRTPADHPLPQAPGVRLVNAVALRDWV